uniref:Putative coiled-coil domain-containing protein n=1 Tax=Tabanus bromius TaxID=304241 RepID=A0A0K8TN93_TABBR
MSKKMFANTKAAEARGRKLALKKATQKLASQEEEDRQWEDDDKLLMRRKQRREEEERKRHEQLSKKAANKILLEEELSLLKPSDKSSCSAKKTRAQIQDECEKRKSNLPVLVVCNPPQNVCYQPKLEKNLNRVMSDVEVATNVDQAIAVLKVGNNHPHLDKEIKAAFKAFEELHISRIRKDYPTLRMSQWRNILLKEWNKSRENPYNSTFWK